MTNIENFGKPVKTSVSVYSSTKGKLDRVKLHHRESYDECINRLIDKVKDHYE
jgi:hypothetical protein